MKLKLLLTLLALGIFINGCCVTSRPKVVIKYRETSTLYNSVVALRISRLEKDKGFMAGAGFAISKKYLITAGHVCAVVGNLGISDVIDMYYINNNSELALSAGHPKIVVFDKIKDLCLLKLEKHGIVPLPIIRHYNQNVKIGDDVLTIGSPLGTFPVYTEGKVVSANLRQKLITSIPTAPGNSGGPIINDVGQIIGVDIERAVAYEHLTLATPANVLRKFLRENKVRIH